MEKMEIDQKDKKQKLETIPEEKPEEKQEEKKLGDIIQRYFNSQKELMETIVCLFQKIDSVTK